MYAKIVLTSILLFAAVPCFANERTETFLKLVLDNMSEIHQHHIGVEMGAHELYVSKDGSEAVYDAKTGKIILDPTNMGTYNFFVYSQGAEHCVADTLPWLFNGNSGSKWAAAGVPSKGQDQSVYEDRVKAWMQDFIDATNKVCVTMPGVLDKPQQNLFQENELQRFAKQFFQVFLDDEPLQKALEAGHNRFCSPQSKEEKAILTRALFEQFGPKTINNKEIQEAYKQLQK
ncbi:MAG: hypothetical protein J6Y85_01230 [Alphaproteobacteria bacterium]|nr:hypothetical protein [Alphaproteobacteria bacterium]